MRARTASAVLLTVFAGATVSMSAQQTAPTPPPQSVVVPSLPDQKNKAGTVRPEGALQTDSEGYARTRQYSPDAPPAKPAGGDSSAAAPAPSSPAAPAGTPLPVGPAPTGKGIATGANYLNVRGTVLTFEPGKSLTIKIQRTGATVEYTLAEKASVPKDLKEGEVVRVRVNVLEKGRVADRVERIPAGGTPSAKK